MSKIIAIIPARYNSTRLPGKVLEEIQGKSIIQHVYEKVQHANHIDEIIIATDDQRIIDASSAFGAQAEMTFPSHKSGTDRCAQVGTEFWSDDIIINVQGDEPFIDSEIIDFLAKKMKDDSWIEISTLCSRITSNSDIQNPNVVKVVRDINNKALYFSRSMIPFSRDIKLEKVTFFKHIGIYAYRNKALQEITKMSESNLENLEKLEQLRWLENGKTIHAFTTNYSGFGIDTLEDLERAKKMF